MITVEQVHKDLTESLKFRRDWKRRWVRQGVKPFLRWDYNDAGILIVQHCGHPTALRPYEVLGVEVDPVPGYGGMSPTFTNLRAAQIAAFVKFCNNHGI